MRENWSVQRDTKDAHAQKRSCEETARRQPPASHKGRPRKKPNLLKPGSWTSMLTTLLSLPIHDHGMFLHLFRTFLISFIFFSI